MRTSFGGGSRSGGLPDQDHRDQKHRDRLARPCVSKDVCPRRAGASLRLLRAFGEVTCPGRFGKSRLGHETVALVFIFFSCGEDFPRSSLGPGWRELPIVPPWRADAHWKELPHHFFNRQSAISPPRRGNENLAFGLRLRAALYHYRLSAFVACCFSSWCKMFPDLNQQGIRSLTSRKIPSTAGRFSIAPPRCWPGPPWGPRRLPMGASWVSK